MSAILPPQRTIALTYDRLLEYLLLEREMERCGGSAEAVAALVPLARTYLPLRGALTLWLLAKTDEGSLSDIVMLLDHDDAEVATEIGVNLLVELEQMNPARPEAARGELAATQVGRLVEALVQRGSPRLGRLLRSCGEKLEELGLCRRAEFIYERVVAGTDEGTEPEEAARALASLGDMQGVFGRNREALDTYERALALWDRVGNRGGIQRILDSIGRIYSDIGNLGTAREYLERSLLIDRELVATGGGVEARRGEAESLLNLARNCARAGELTEALGFAREAMVVWKELGDRKGLARVMSQICSIRRRQGLTEEALRHGEQALAVYQELGDKRGAAAALRNLGIAYHMEARWDEALARYRDAMGIAQELGDKKAVASTLVAMGETLRWAGALDEATQVYARALALYREMESSYGVAMCLNNLGATRLFAGDPLEAIRYLREARDLYDDLYGGAGGDPECLAYLSAASWDAGRHEEALAASDAAVRALEVRSFGDEETQLVQFHRYRILAGLGRRQPAGGPRRLGTGASGSDGTGRGDRGRGGTPDLPPQLPAATRDCGDVGAGTAPRLAVGDAPASPPHWMPEAGSEPSHGAQMRQRRIHGGADFAHGVSDLAPDTIARLAHNPVEQRLRVADALLRYASPERLLAVLEARAPRQDAPA